MFAIGRGTLFAAAILALMAVVCLRWQSAAADSLYKYRDVNGNLVYSDRKPDSTASTSIESLAYSAEKRAPRINVQAVNDATKWILLATNECQCVVEFDAKIVEAHNLNIANGSSFHQVLLPQSQQALVEISHSPTEGAVDTRLTWRGILGTPGAEHHPPTPYRAPFAIGSSYLVTQAFPFLTTHRSRADQYAVDIALPDGTPVYAAREGTVINIQHDKYLSAATPIMMDQANMVEILHDDGTIAVYAHLHWDSVRVQPGQHVQRGEYIADSGNTGFSTGPHLHFSVFRNAGNAVEALPIQFLGPGGTAITPQANTPLTAY